MMSNGIASQKLRRVKWVSDGLLCQVKLFMSEDCPAQVGSNVEDHLQSKRSSHSNGMSSDDMPPGFGGTGYQDTLNQTCIPQIKWKRPPMFILNSDWHVVAGEQSEETGVQNHREMSVLEAVYPRASAIPPSPLVSPELGGCNYDDKATPIIPVIPIEEEDGTYEESPPCSSSAAMSQHGFAASSAHYNIPVDSKAMAADKPNGVFNGLEADVAAAASAAFTAILQSSEKGSMVDTDLLIKILNDPKLIEALLKDSASTTTQLTPKYEPNTGQYSHNSVSKVPLDGNSNIHTVVQDRLRAASDTLLYTKPTHVPTLSTSNARPCTIPFVERGNENSNQFFNYQQSSSSTSSAFASVPPSLSLPMQSLEPHAVSSRLDNVNHLLQALVSTPTALSSLGSRLANPSTLPASLHGPITSEKLGNGKLELPRDMPTASSHLSVSNAASSGQFTHPGTYAHLQSSQPSWKSTDAFSPKAGDLFTSHSHRSNVASPAIPENQSRPSQAQSFMSSLQSASVPPDRPPLPSMSSARTPVVKDSNYYMSLIRQHGMERKEAQEEFTPQYQSGGPELSAVSGQGHARPKIQKPCKFFNTASGCRKGSSCQFEHGSLVNLSDSERSSKRFKFSRD